MRRPTYEDTVRVDFQVPAECSGWRLDHFLRYRIPRLSRTKIHRIIPVQITLPNGRPPRPSTIVREGERVILRRPAPEEPDVPRYFEVLREGEDFLAINKPAGLPIHTTAKFLRNTLTSLLREKYPDQTLHVCHRLDRETSGVMLIAKDTPGGKRLSNIFATRQAQKSYLALVKGRLVPASGIIDQPLRLKTESETGIMMTTCDEAHPRALNARTAYQTLAVYTPPPRASAPTEGPGHAHSPPLDNSHAVSKVAIDLATGRQHQIRVHLNHIGHPVVGDKLYGAGEPAFMAYCDGGLTSDLLAQFDGLDRQALHAHRLCFQNPQNGETEEIVAPWPESLESYAQRVAKPGHLDHQNL